MATNPQQLAESIKSGEYYEQSRAWYRTVYIGPVSERTFFLMVASFAGIIAFTGFLALMAILPLKSRPAILIRSDRIEDVVPRLLPLRPPGATVNGSIQRFFVENYVLLRESYSAADYATNFNFIQGQSDPATFAAYMAGYDRSNRNSPAAILGETGKRVVTVNAVDIGSGTATVHFTTEIQGIGEGKQANWTAVLHFNYSALELIPTIDPTTGRSVYKTQDPHFQVIDYVLTQVR